MKIYLPVTKLLAYARQVKQVCIPDEANLFQSVSRPHTKLQAIRYRQPCSCVRLA